MLRWFRFFSLWPLWALHALGALGGWAAWLFSGRYRRRFLDNARLAGLGWLGIRAGWGLSPFSVTVATLVAALPSASNVALLSERFGADTARIARIILWSTAWAFLSFSAAVAWLL